VPGRGPLRVGVLADEAAGKQDDVGAGERLHQIQRLVAEEGLQQPRIAEMRSVQLVGERAVLLGEVFLEAALQPRVLLRRKQGLVMEDIAVLVIEAYVLRRECGHPLSLLSR
jgi:hypothetical protein